MINLGKGISDFLKFPDQYVLRLKGNDLTARKKGVFTWLLANIFDHQSFKLPNILTNVSQRGLNQNQEIVLNRLKDPLTEKIRKYNASRKVPPIDVALIDTLFAKTLPHPERKRVESPKLPEHHMGPSEAASAHNPAFTQGSPSLEMAKKTLDEKLSGSSEHATSPKAPLVPLSAEDLALQKEAPPPPALEPLLLQAHGFPSPGVVNETLGGRLLDIIPTYPKKLTREEQAHEQALRILESGNEKRAMDDPQFITELETLTQAIKKSIPDAPAEETQAFKEEKDNAFGLDLISKAGFKICHAIGDGNCLFTSIAIGMLSRIQRDELLQKLDLAVAKASAIFFTASVEGGDKLLKFPINIATEWQELKAHISLDAPQEITAILINAERRNKWALLLRELSLAGQLNRHMKDADFFSFAMRDHEFTSDQEEHTTDEYLLAMMPTSPPTLWGSATDIFSLQDLLGISIPLLNGKSSGIAGHVVIMKSNQLLPLAELIPADIPVLFNPASHHYDPAFYFPTEP